MEVTDFWVFLNQNHMPTLYMLFVAEHVKIAPGMLRLSQDLFVLILMEAKI